MKPKSIRRIAIQLILISTFLQSYSQNYRVIQPGRTSQFINSSMYNILSMQVDSVTISGTDTICFLLKNLQQMGWDCYHVQGPSWMGDRITIRPDGETSFYNIYDKPVLIKTRASLYEEWICYTETGLSFRASVSSVGIQDILGISDSVKTISFQALDIEGQNTDHVLNNMNLILSKNYGLVKTLNFFDFPEYGFGITANGIDEFTLSGYNNPETGIQNLTWKLVHDHNIGDELHTKMTQSDIGLYKYTENIATLLDKEISGDTIVNIWENKTKISILTPDSNTFTANIDTITMKISTDPDFDNLAGTAWQYWGDGYTINFMGVGEHGLTKTYGSLDIYYLVPEIYLGDTCYATIIYDGCLSVNYYYKGLGGPYYSCSYGFESSIRELVYFKKDSVEWGTPLEFTVNTPQIPIDQSSEVISIFPNPAREVVNIKLNNYTGNWNMTILDSRGMESGNYMLKAKESQINIQNLKSGIYLFRFTSENQNVIRKIVKL